MKNIFLNSFQVLRLILWAPQALEPTHRKGIIGLSGSDDEGEEPKLLRRVPGSKECRKAN